MGIRVFSWIWAAFARLGREGREEYKKEREGKEKLPISIRNIT